MMSACSPASAAFRASRSFMALLCHKEADVPTPHDGAQAPPVESREPEPAAPAAVSLREITAETVRQVCMLEVSESQRVFVAPNAISIAQAYFEPRAWFRAVYAGEEPVGFAMLEVDLVKHSYYLWRFMIDHRYQGRGFGKQALALVIEHVRTLPEATALELSYHAGPGEPAPFYARLGFEETGRIEEGERVMRLALLPA